MTARWPKIAGIIASLAVGLVATTPAQAGRPSNAADRVVFTIKSPQITESSALAVSTTKPRLVYTINDSGDAANVYALDSRSGDLVGTTSLGGVEARDIEAIATGTDGKLVVADIGDNKGDHASLTIHRIEQPGRGDHQVSSESVSLTYSNGPRDAESILYDAESGRVYVISKQFAGARVYRSPPDVFDRSSAVVKPIAAAPGLATDATFVPPVNVAVIRTYFDAVAYRFPSWKKITNLSLPRQPQGESITAPRRGDEVWVGSEGERSEVLAVALPDLQPEQPKPTATTAPTRTQGEAADSSDNEQLKDAARVVIVGAGAALFVLLLLGAFLYRRHQPHGD